MRLWGYLILATILHSTFLLASGYIIATTFNSWVLLGVIGLATLLYARHRSIRLSQDIPKQRQWRMPNAKEHLCEGDPLVDELIAMDTFSRPLIKYGNALQVIEGQLEGLRAKLSSGLETEEARAKAEKQIVLMERLLKDIQTVPDWVNWDMIERGRVIYKENILLISVGLAVALLESYTFPIDAQVLVITGGLASNQQSTARRLMETGYWIFNIMKNGIRPGQKGVSAALCVRLLHGFARNVCMHSDRWHSDRHPPAAGEREKTPKKSPLKRSISAPSSSSAPSSPQTLSRSNSGRVKIYRDVRAKEQLQADADADAWQVLLEGEHEDEVQGKAEGEVPVNQATMCGTLFLFCQVVLQVAELRGAHLTEHDKECYWHLWRYVGHLLGVKDEVMPRCYLDGVQARMAPLYLNRQKPNDTSRLLTRESLGAMTNLPDIPFHVATFNVTMRRFLGDKLCDDIGVRGTSVFDSALWHVATMYLTYVYLANTVCAPMKCVCTYGFNKFIERAYERYFLRRVPRERRSSDPNSPLSQSSAGDLSSSATKGELKRSSSKTSRCPFGFS